MTIDAALVGRTVSIDVVSIPVKVHPDRYLAGLRPVAVISGVNTTPALLMVHVDHFLLCASDAHPHPRLTRPIKMTSAAGAVVWSAVYSPFGGAYTLSGSETLNARFPGHFSCSTLGKPVLTWFQMSRAFRPARGTRVGRRIKRAGLHYNWHRHYDPSLGRYTQPDPLGFVDGPSVYAYARNSSLRHVDPDGRLAGQRLN